jgi:hypothetical protein
LFVFYYTAIYLLLVHFLCTLLINTGDEDEQDCRYYSLYKTSKPKHFWSVQKSDLNTILAPTRAQLHSEVMSTMRHEPTQGAMLPGAVVPDSPSQANSHDQGFPLDRRAMEVARLARLGDRKREPSPEPVLFNPGQGSLDAWQLGESVDDFVKRLPPLTTSVFTCAWIWAHDPYFDSRVKITCHRTNEFTSRGKELLGQSLRTREQIQTNYLHGPKAEIIRSLNQESKALQQRITDLAVECGILSGKVSLTFFALLCERS